MEQARLVPGGSNRSQTDKMLKTEREPRVLGSVGGAQWKVLRGHGHLTSYKGHRVLGRGVIEVKCQTIWDSVTMGDIKVQVLVSSE